MSNLFLYFKFAVKKMNTYLGKALCSQKNMSTSTKIVYVLLITISSILNLQYIKNIKHTITFLNNFKHIFLCLKIWQQVNGFVAF